ncbi:MAG: hypothetical protein ACFFE2_02875 [Candidatus Thorarchaeota archaeon]
MEKSRGPAWATLIVTSIFIILTSLFILLAFSGFAWNIITEQVFSFWLTILTIGLAISAMAVSTYSFVLYIQIRDVRHLMLILLGANIVIWSFLFLVTHPSSELWSGVFSDRDRNRTLAMALVLAVVPSILLGSFVGEVKPKRSIKLILITWGTLIMPCISLWLFLSQEPVFIMVIGDGGVEGLTLIGAILSMVYLISQILALIRFAYKWWKTRNIIDLSLLLALAVWTMGTGFIIVLWNPLQIAELLWVASIISGFLIIGSVQFLTAIIEPHRFLENQVAQRTRELNLSKQESEFYLKMWTHKMGNLLQGLVVYLDILEMASQNSEEDMQTRSAASDLSREAAMLNQQVIQLTRIKESLDQVLWPVNLPEAFEDAVKSATKLLGDHAFKSEFTYGAPITVDGDNLLPLAFHSTIAYFVKNRLVDQPVIKVSVGPEEAPRSVKIACKGKPIPESLRTFLEGDELRGQIALDIDLFTIKLLMNRYQATVECGRNEATEENVCRFIFPESTR